MTARTAPLGPDAFVERFVTAASVLFNRARARCCDIERDARLRMMVILGGGASVWALQDPPQLLLDLDRAPEVDGQARALARSVVGSLSVADAGKLMRRMEPDDEPGSAPGYFFLVIEVLGSSWNLKVAAWANGSTATLASIDGTLVEPEPAEKAAA